MQMQDASVKGCYEKGRHPAEWWTKGIRCLPNQDCWCYHAPPPGNVNGIDHGLRI